MCRIITATNMSKIDPIKASQVAAKLVGKTEKDGFGYAILGEKGQFGEKTIADVFRSRFKRKNFVTEFPVKQRYLKFGEFSNPVGPGIFHGRTSTNVKGLDNCHPMMMDGWSLIHNGVVDNIGAKYKKKTQNDSEDVLFKLIQGIDHVERDLEGYYAFCAIDDKGQLHIARDEYATLFCAWSAKVESLILATTEELVIEFSKELDLKIGPVEEMPPNTYVIMKGNKIVHSEEIVPYGIEYRQARHSSASLGQEIIVKGSGEISEATIDEMQDFIDRDYNNELLNMDASYTIVFEDTNDILTPAEFHKLPKDKQKRCFITRYDGTVVDKEDYQYYHELLAKGVG